MSGNQRAGKGREVCAFLADDGSAQAGDGAVVLIGEQAGVVESERDLCAGGDGLRKENGDEEGIAGVALEVECFAVRGFYVFQVEILIQLDADAAGDFVGDEIDFGNGGERLAAGIERGGDVVMLGEEGGAARDLRAFVVAAQRANATASKRTKITRKRCAKVFLA